MKHLVFASILLICFTLSGCMATRLSSEQKAIQQQALAQEISERLNGMNFHVAITTMFPRKGPSKTLSHGYYLSVENGVMDSYLPYFGEVYTSYIGATGVVFKEKIDAWQIERNEKRHFTRLTMLIKRSEDNYTYRLDVYDNATASLFVYCNRREDISYEGDFECAN